MTGMKWDRVRKQAPPLPPRLARPGSKRAATVERVASQTFAQIEYRTPCRCGSERYIVRDTVAKCCSCGRIEDGRPPVVGSYADPTPDYLANLRSRLDAAITRGQRRQRARR